MKDFYVKDAARFDNTAVTTYFCLNQIQVRDRKGGGQYLALTLSDKTGTLEARMWEDFAEAFQTCGEGCYVKVQGQISKYQGKFQITLTKLRNAAENEIEAADFQPVSAFPAADMDAELRGYIAAFKDRDLQRLILAFLDDPEIGPAFRIAPAAKLLHHAWISGLLEHVLCLVRVCLANAPFYPVNPDLLVTGAILHDIGKIRELSWKTSFNYTLEGQMIGHISIAQGMLREKVQQLAPFPEKLRILVEHMILSHHGKYEYGSPKLPMTPEAMLLSALDDLEAKFAATHREFAAAEDAGKRPDELTDWVRSMERPLLNSARWLADGVAQEEPEPTQQPEPTTLFPS
ncbi:3'-5' exoribonuclease YhaM family protein [Granulicella tundricola]|uniref:Metal dependent phosphohydrolase n=1 Tax=Granulicella tundricola (strain ATCC BAA-1859 / DSM 23138 / MP5ACTX9) TaxID=1198114 RepID=E8X3I9_GRATM|nr:HD domain-containing protein [Granulicella tundricola]ADW68180.1 metal dependent phosphohydrolase [Granulicella tundricola MP5ACTX9]